MKRPPDLQERLRQAVEREMEERWLTSTLAEWMQQHHAEAAELLGHQGMNWTKAAQAFAGSGLRDQLGQAPTHDTARETWRRVQERRRAGLQLRKRKG